MDKLKKSSIKIKLILSILLISIFCISVTLAITYSSYKLSLEKTASDQLNSSLLVSKKKVGEYYKRTKSFTELLASDRLTEGLFLSYESAFYAAGYSIGKDQVIHSEAFNKLDVTYKNKALERVNSYDIANFILVNIAGQVVFSAQPPSNDVFLGKSLTKGALNNTKLAQCVRAAKDSNSKKTFYADFENFPQIKKTMGFYCINVFSEFVHLSEGINKGDLLGTVAIEIDTDHINSILSDHEGGSNGKTYLEGDLSSITDSPNRKNNDILKAVIPTDIEGKSWNLVTENKKSEIYAPLKQLLKEVFLYSLAVLLIVFFAGIYLINILLRPIINASETLADVCTFLNKDSLDLSKSAMTLDDSSKDQASSLQMTVQAIQEISTTIEQNTSNASNTEKLARSSLEMAEKGRSVIVHMMESMKEINKGNQDILSQVDESNVKINEILVMISEIENKTKLINDIVFQTKLLSFNASVEAARAGENGKGFAVVAEEIGNLAQSSGNSAKDISALLTESISKVESIIKETTQKMEQVSNLGRVQVKSGQESSARCSEVFDQIIKSFNQVAELVIEISHASNDQNTGMGEINQAMTRLNAGTDKSTQIASESSQAAGQLESRAKTLEEVVQKIQNVIHGC